MERWHTAPTEEYLAFRNEVSERAGELFSRYCEHLKCRRGCSFCCDNIHVAPIERAAVAFWLDSDEGRGVREAARERRTRSGPPGTGAEAGTAPKRNRCAFLGDQGECTVYPVRPVICRTYGLPLAYRVYEYDMHGRELHPDAPEYTELWCDLNFTELTQDEAKDMFATDGHINQTNLDARLEALNSGFVEKATDAARGIVVHESSRPLEELL
jgi:Fe-S-cluster containining protein